MVEEEETAEMDEASRSEADYEDMLENGDVHFNPVRVLDALTENDDGEQLMVGPCEVLRD